MFNKRTLTDAPVLWNAGIALALIVYAAGLFIIPMEPDATIYAEVSMEMYQRWNFLEIFRKGADWLDKPHFPFWITALSYKVFGLNYFAYKFPGVLFVLFGGWYTWLFGRRFYGRLQGLLAVFLLLTAEHIIISNQDVRAEPYMTGLTIMGLYHVASYLRTKKFRDLLLKDDWEGIVEMGKEAVGEGPMKKVEQMVGTGPYIAKSYQPNQLVVLAANPNYHGGKVAIQGIERFPAVLHSRESVSRSRAASLLHVAL